MTQMTSAIMTIQMMMECRDPLRELVRRDRQAVMMVTLSIKIIKDRKLPLAERFAAQLKLSKLPRNSAQIRVVNRCEITGRPHGVYRKLKISRIALREMASSGKIPGMTKSSW